ncbi:MAG: thioredoxin domain-containing protein, partial [Halanaeroarchaeum sp.]
TTVVAVGDAPGSDLHRAACRVADHEKVVAPNAHVNESPAPRSVAPGSAVVLAGDSVSDSAETPEELMTRVAETAE